MLLNTYNQIILRHFIFILFPCESIGLFMSKLCYLFFIFSLIFIVINQKTSLKQTYLFFVYFLEYLLLFLDHNVDEEWEYFSNSKSSAPGCCLAFTLFFANFSLALLIKVLLIKKACRL